MVWRMGLFAFCVARPARDGTAHRGQVCGAAQRRIAAGQGQLAIRQHCLGEKVHGVAQRRVAAGRGQLVARRRCLGGQVRGAHSTAIEQSKDGSIVSEGQFAELHGDVVDLLDGGIVSEGIALEGTSQERYSDVGPLEQIEGTIQERLSDSGQQERNEEQQGMETVEGIDVSLVCERIRHQMQVMEKNQLEMKQLSQEQDQQDVFVPVDIEHIGKGGSHAPLRSPHLARRSISSMARAIAP